MDLLDLIFPKKCINCGHWGKYICDKCEIGLGEKAQICPTCLQFSFYGLRHPNCRTTYCLDGLTCLWEYEGLARKIIKKAKDNYYFDLLSELFNRGNSILDRGDYTYLQKFLIEKPVIVPVPSHPKRFKERGFNQAQVFAKLIAKKWSLEIKQLLIRTDTSFKALGKADKVLLIDDVWVTGATLKECTKTLKKAGIQKVWGLTLAR